MPGGPLLWTPGCWAGTLWGLDVKRPRAGGTAGGMATKERSSMRRASYSSAPATGTSEGQRRDERLTLHRISVGLHKIALVRDLSMAEKQVYAMAQRALTPEVTRESILSYLGRGGE